MDVFSTFFRISSFIVKSDYLTKVDKRCFKIDLLILLKVSKSNSFKAISWRYLKWIIRFSFKRLVDLKKSFVAQTNLF